MQAQRIAEGRTIDHTPGTAVAVGAVVEIGDGLIGIAERPIAANQLGALAVEGVFNLAKDNSIVAAGAALYWDSDGNPVGGTAGSGAATTTVAGNKLFAVALQAAGTTVGHVRALLVQQSILGAQIEDLDGRVTTLE